MSLKAYDGMITNKGFKYLQDNILNRIDSFKEASLNELYKTYAELFTKHVDGINDLKWEYNFDSINEKQINTIINNEIDWKSDEYTLLNTIKQGSYILSKSKYRNDHTKHLFISIEEIEKDIILVYPNICVKKHKEILLEFIDDYYCQDQVDKDDSVSLNEWEERYKRWYNFNDNKFYKSTIKLFDPESHIDNIVRSVSLDDETINKILSHIPSESERLKNKVKELVFKEISSNKVIKISDYIIFENSFDENQIKDYINKNNITLDKIDFDTLKNRKLNP